MGGCFLFWYSFTIHLWHDCSSSKSNFYYLYQNDNVCGRILPTRAFKILRKLHRLLWFGVKWGSVYSKYHLAGIFNSFRTKCFLVLHEVHLVFAFNICYMECLLLGCLQIWAVYLYRLKFAFWISCNKKDLTSRSTKWEQTNFENHIKRPRWHQIWSQGAYYYEHQSTIRKKNQEVVFWKQLGLTCYCANFLRANTGRNGW